MGVKLPVTMVIVPIMRDMNIILVLTERINIMVIVLVVAIVKQLIIIIGNCHHRHAHVYQHCKHRLHTVAVHLSYLLT